MWNIMRASGGLYVCKSSDQASAYWLLSCFFTVAKSLQAYLCSNTLEMTQITAARSHDHKDQGTELGSKWKGRDNKVNIWRWKMRDPLWHQEVCFGQWAVNEQKYFECLLLIEGAYAYPHNWSMLEVIKEPHLCEVTIIRQWCSLHYWSDWNGNYCFLDELLYLEI